MSIKVKIPPVLRQVTDPGSAEFDCLNLGQCIKELDAVIPGIGLELTIQNGSLLSSAYDFFINGRRSYPAHLSTPLKEGDEVVIVPLDTDVGG